MPVVKLFANLRKLAGTKEVSITGANVGAVVSELVSLKPALDGVLLENGRLRPHVLVTLNGHTTNDLSLPVAEQDVIAIFPPIAGG
jgi:MoaD family protein